MPGARALIRTRPVDPWPIRHPRWLLLAMLAQVFICAACTPGPAVVLHGSHGATVRVRVEIVSTPSARAQGLMYRRDLAPDAGMLFIFPRQEVQGFWMKNTLIPLDMVFIDSERRVVGIIAEARPMSTQSVGVDTPSRYVLEVNGGFTARHGIVPGAMVEFVAVPEDAS